MAATQRYWDGVRWSEHIAPGVPVVHLSPPAQKDDSTLIVVGFLTAIFIPIVGFVIGCVLCGRRGAVGAAILILSVVSALLWFGYFAEQQQQRELDRQLEQYSYYDSY